MITNFGIYLTKHGIQRKDLAYRIGVKDETLYKYELGESLPRWEIAVKIAKELKLSLEEFLTFFDISYE